MCLLIETINVVDGQMQNLHYHNVRLNRSRKELLGCTDNISIAEVVKIPNDALLGIYRCTVKYNEAIIDCKFVQYSVREIKSLKLVYDNQIEYAYKYANRSKLNELVGKREACDEILIIKNGLVTDTSYTNILFYDGVNWVTPVTPLLKGTKRQRLLDERKIVEIEIHEKEIKNFNKACLINAMIDIEEVVINCSKIY